MSSIVRAGILTLAVSATCSATAPAESPSWPLRIPTPSGEVILIGPHEKEAYDQYGYAAVRTAGSLVFISGVVVGRRPDEGTDVPAFKEQVRRAFRRVGSYLRAAGLTFDDVVMINSFHVWEGPNFKGTRVEQFRAFEEVKEEFMKGSKPAWTAVGTSSLLPDAGVVEVQMIAQTRGPR